MKTRAAAFPDTTDEANWLRAGVQVAREVLDRRAALKSQVEGSSEPFDGELLAMADRDATKAMQDFQNLSIAFTTQRLIRIADMQNSILSRAEHALFNLVLALAELGVDLKAKDETEFAQKLAREITDPLSASMRKLRENADLADHMKAALHRRLYWAELEAAYSNSRAVLSSMTPAQLLALAEREEKRG